MNTFTISRLYLLLAIASLPLAGCVSTKITSMVDPMYDGTKFGTILVMSLHENSGLASRFESEMVEQLDDIGVKAFRNREVLPPLRTYTDEEKLAQYKKYGIDAVLIIAPQGANTSTVTVPTYSQSRAAYGGRSAVAETITVGGDKREVVNDVSTQARLINIANGSAVWQGDATTDILNKYANIGSIVSSFCSNVAKKLSEYNLVEETGRTRWSRRRN